MSDYHTVNSDHKVYILPRHLWYVVLAFISFASAVSLLFIGPTLTFAVVGVIIIIAFMFYSPYVGICTYLVFEYARIPAMFPELGVIDVMKLVVVPTIVIFFLHYITIRDTRIVFDKIYWAFLSWLTVAFISTAFAINKQLSIDGTVDLLKWLVTVFLIINLVVTLPKWKIFMWLYLLLNLKICQFQIRRFFAGIEMARDTSWFIQQGVGAGTGGFFSNSNDFGIAMVVVTPLAFYLFTSVKSLILKLIAAGLTISFTVGILLSSSRGAALGFFASLVAFWFKSRNRLIGLILVTAIGVSFWVIAPEPWKERFISAKDYEEDATASARIRLWNGGIQMFINNPLTGVGVHNFTDAWIGSYRPPGVGGATVVHNMFLQAASELGIGGVLAVIVILVIVFRRNRETREIYYKANIDEPWIINFSHALDCSLIGFVVHGFFLTVLYFPHLYMITALAISLNFIAKQRTSANINIPGPNILKRE